MKLSIVGAGYVGLVTGACLAENGHDVICVDVDPRKVDAINSGRAPIHEAGLDDLLRQEVPRRLRATTDLGAAVEATDVTFIAVGTPARDGRIDLQYVEQAAASIGEAIGRKGRYHVVVVKSTVVPGTTDGPVRRALEGGSGLRAGDDFGLGMNPEFLTEGQAVDDFRRPDRIVLGGLDDRTIDTLVAVYEGFESVPRILTNTRTAEFIKYASNALLATAISFSNEMARLCTRIGDVDVVDVLEGVHESAYLTTRNAASSSVTARIAAFLGAGCGFGGSCLPKDLTALAAHGEALDVQMPLLRAVLAVNRVMPDEMVRLITRHYPDLSGIHVAVLGLAFKPDTDDVRESPAFPVIARLREAGANVVAFDPVARPEHHPDLSGVRLAASLDDAVAEADVVALVTRWAEFAVLPELLSRIGRSPLVVDGRRMLPKDAFARYEGIGWQGPS